MEEWLNLNPSTGPAQAHVVHAQAAGASAAPVGQQQQQGDAAAAAARTTFSLVAYPSKDNYEGRLHSLDWIDKVRIYVVLLFLFVRQHGEVYMQDGKGAYMTTLPAPCSVLFCSSHLTPALLPSML